MPTKPLDEVVREWTHGVSRRLGMNIGHNDAPVLIALTAVVGACIEVIQHTPTETWHSCCLCGAWWIVGNETEYHEDGCPLARLDEVLR